MLVKIKRNAALIMMLAALIGAVFLTACECRTYNMTDPGRPSDTFSAFFKAVLDGDDATAGSLLYNYAWTSCKPQGNPDSDGYAVDGILISGSDASVMNCLMNSRSCRIVSESDYTKDDLNASVTVEYTTFALSGFQKELAKQSVAEVKEQRYLGKVFQDENDTREVIERIKAKLLQDPQPFYTTQRYRIDLVSVKGKWKIVMTEDFYNALTGYPN